MYNSKDTIIRALDSVRNQTAYDSILEVIVVNDGSKDDSSEIVSKYKEKNPDFPLVLVDKKNGGVSTARNKGMELAKGEWIALLDSDDEWFYDKLEVQINIIKQNSDVDFLGGPFNDKVLKIFTKKIDKLYKAQISDICIRNFPQPSTVVFKKEIYNEIGGFDEKQRYAEDGNYFLKICGKYNLYYFPKRLITYDDGKRGFGSSGLSANLKEMYAGNKKNIIELYYNKQIKFFFLVFLRVYYYLKYIRRIFLTRINK